MARPPPPGASPAASERIVLQIECVCNTAPAPRDRTIARCNVASADGVPAPPTTRPCSSISTMWPGSRTPLSTPLVVIASVRGVRSTRSEEHTSELQSRPHLVCRLLLEKKKQKPLNPLEGKKKK